MAKRIIATAALAAGISLGALSSHASAGVLVFTSFTLDNPATVAREGYEWTNNQISNSSTGTTTTENPKTGSWALTWDGVRYASYCIEPLQALRFNSPYTSYTWSTLSATNNPGLTATQRDRINKLYESSYDQSLIDSAHSAAFQLALWEILFDSTLDLTQGKFSTTTNDGNPATNDTPVDVLTMANAMIANLDSRNMGNWDFSWLQHDQVQDQLIASRVPLPGTAALLAFGIFGYSRRNKRMAG